MRTILRDVKLVQNQEINQCDIIIENNNISDIVPACKADTTNAKVIDLKNKYASAGFIDIHLHGGDGYDFMDGTEKAFEKISKLHLKHGTTAMMPTTLASSTTELLQTLELFKKCKSGFDGGSKFIGIHIEGPYINKTQAGAQDLRFIHSPEKEEYLKVLKSSKDIMRWTIAPELDGALELGDILNNHSILPCIGHSQATINQVKNAMQHGYTHITHLYSATSSIVRINGFRHAGIVESAYLYDDLTSEIIADGCHLPKELLQLAYKFIGPKRLALITDAMRGAGKTSGESILGSLKNGQKVILEDGVAKMPDRKAFAGSICTADRLVRTMTNIAGITLADAIRMITQTPAEIMGVSDKYGYLGKGRAADIVIFDEDINISMVFIDGENKIERV